MESTKETLVIRIMLLLFAGPLLWISLGIIALGIACGGQEGAEVVAIGSIALILAIIGLVNGISSKPKFKKRPKREHAQPWFKRINVSISPRTKNVIVYVIAFFATVVYFGGIACAFIISVVSGLLKHV